MGLVLALALVLGLALAADRLRQRHNHDHGGSTTTAARRPPRPRRPPQPPAPRPVRPRSETSTSVAGKSDLILASTTSTQDSGLFDVLIPAFTKAFPQYNVKVVAVGSGEALTLGQNGDADVLLVHSPAAEVDFMTGRVWGRPQGGHVQRLHHRGSGGRPGEDQGHDRRGRRLQEDRRYQVFVLHAGTTIGHQRQRADPLEGRRYHPVRLWYQIDRPGHGRDPDHLPTRRAATRCPTGPPGLPRRDSLTNLALLVEGDKALFNQYHVITCKAAKNVQGANDFLNWIISPDVQQNVIATYGVDKYGQALFVPNAATAQ